jgi:hypothetical protein
MTAGNLHDASPDAALVLAQALPIASSSGNQLSCMAV